MDAGAGLAAQRIGVGELNTAAPTTARKLTGAEWSRVRSAFETLIDLSPSQREFRIGRFDFDLFLTGRLRAMLAAQDTAGLLDGEPPPPSAPDMPTYSSLEPGAVVGGFRIERLIGRGGMGEVYLARREDADFTQQVALKLLRPEAVGGFDGFAAERRLLAGLEHPGIARLIDGGIAPDGRPFMALEYVDGQEINGWCTARHANLATRLTLFLALCDAVGYAHARLVVHRDIKPANILVDADGRARLLDFGIARLLDTGTGQRTMTQALATPQYAAPEQLEGSALTVATDIYALGAVLFELLAGRGPWQCGDRAALPTVMRRLLHDDPPAPSRVTDDSAIPAARIAGDLDAIVAKAMRRTPAERYSSVEALAEDVRRHLSYRPVQARAGATGYRVRRYLRRNRLAVAASAAVIVALLAGAIGIAWQARKASEERDVARAEAERSEAVNQAMMLMFREAGETSQVETITARELIDNTAKRVAMAQSPDSTKSAAVVGAIADLYMIVENVTGAQALLEAARARGIGRNDPVGAAQLKAKLAAILGSQRRFDEARQLLRESDAVWRTDPIRFRHEHVESVGVQAYMLRLEGKRDEGIALLLGNLREAELAYADDSRDLATRYGNLAKHLVEANRLDEAAAIVARSRTKLIRAGLGRSPSALTLSEIEATIASRRGNPTAAAALLQRVVSSRSAWYGASTALAVDLLQYGRVLLQVGRPELALTMLNRAAPMTATYFGAGTQPALMVGLTRAEALLAVGQIKNADRAFGTVSEGLRKEGPTSLLYAARLLTVTRLALAHGDIPAARAAIDEADQVCRTIGPAAAVYASAIGPLRTQIAAKSR